MGELVLAAKCTHVPTMIMSEQEGPLKGKRQPAIDGHRRIGELARAAGADTFVVLDTHWLVNAAYHINANHRFKGLFTSNEFPQFIKDLPYEYEGNAALGDLIAQTATDDGVYTLSHQIDSLELEYGTLVPMRYMNDDAALKVVSVAAMCTVHSLDSSRRLGAAIRKAIEASDSKVALIASGSLSHRIWPNDIYAENNGTFTISSKFNEVVDRRVLELWQNGETELFLQMLPDYAKYCDGEGDMHDSVMLFGALGWDSYRGRGEVMTEYFPSSGTGQTNVLFSLD
ncbi:3,4-dihydroxyphenylacetate 2,3-dioxygenase [Maritimibacter sp. UBA3975]|uniref:3,4-dihydroxyphenylacetate 2,3-dioxygenase n=1 Tax=Maritimibacter sp. UBA3975 TaxID=1946833 RepID=UPI000C0A5FD0|nr:3,4-dihydroxyphenylacetate 2,3-dioxygenase [Maritimibacter sp. UBA3975]MAM61350.1 3,4-dihydroxyphenylacetate 2,3-dioxygenase [Maritimibacter sp.]|tara:strand:+ start:20474 stop:21328 length:855 start_codon:yes stop_codon:yes gene_type:complete